jgi:hypothetical protein
MARNFDLNGVTRLGSISTFGKKLPKNIASPPKYMRALQHFLKTFNVDKKGSTMTKNF